MSYCSICDKDFYSDYPGDLCEDCQRQEDRDCPKPIAVFYRHDYYYTVYSNWTTDEICRIANSNHPHKDGFKLALILHLL